MNPHHALPPWRAHRLIIKGQVIKIHGINLAFGHFQHVPPQLVKLIVLARLSPLELRRRVHVAVNVGQLFHQLNTFLIIITHVGRSRISIQQFLDLMVVGIDDANAGFKLHHVHIKFHRF